MKKLLIPLCIATLATFLMACSHLRFPSVFKIDVAQGNIVTPKLLKQLKPGMTKEQVTYLLGSPLIQDSFHKNRWDYLYSFSEGGETPRRYHVIVYFKDERFMRYEGSVAGDGTPHLNIP